MELPFGGTFAKDTFETGTRAAAFGGTTTIIDFAVQSKGESPARGAGCVARQGEGNATIDYGFHMIMSDVTDATLAEMDALVGEGVTDFKLFTAYPGVFYSDDGAIFRAMQQPAKNGGLIMMHAENGHGHRRRRGADRRGRQHRSVLPRHVALADPGGRGHEPRHPPGRGRAARRYTSSTSRRDEALNEVRRARDEGLPAFAETCPQYLFLSLEDMGNGFEGAKFVCSPPLRPEEHQEDLWIGLLKDDLQVVSTDHCPFDFHGQKDLGEGDFRKVPNGLPGVENRVDLLHHGGVRRGPPDPEPMGGGHPRRAGAHVRPGRQKGVVAAGRRRRPRRLRPDAQAHDQRRRRTTWTSTTRATRAGR